MIIALIYCIMRYSLRFNWIMQCVYSGPHISTGHKQGKYPILLVPDLCRIFSPVQLVSIRKSISRHSAHPLPLPDISRNRLKVQSMPVCCYKEKNIQKTKV